MPVEAQGALEVAALLVPLLALVVVFAVDSVQEDDTLRYRVFVASVGLASLGPIIVGLMYSILSVFPETSVSATKLFIYTLVSFFLVTILIIGTTIVETARGLNEKQQHKYFFGLSVVILIWYIVLLLFFP